jgi:hypothetical protein
MLINQYTLRLICHCNHHIGYAGGVPFVSLGLGQGPGGGYGGQGIILSIFILYILYIVYIVCATGWFD